MDGAHKDHIEVFDKRGRFKKVMNLDGSVNDIKTKSAL
ncbi:filamentous hemagglutinin [Streptococcus gordonii]|nr:filamentous hemagglutinin [Streptococcus gordonii]